MTAQFSRAVDAAHSMAVDVSSSGTAILPSLSHQLNDIDFDDLPSSRNMDVDEELDSGSLSDEEGSIACEPLLDISEDQDDALPSGIEAALRSLDDLDLDSVFDFLPNTNLEDVSIGEAGPGPSTASHSNISHTLLEDEEESRTYVWHPSAGRVYRQEKTVHSPSLFSADASGSDQGYEPFNSRLDWEVAQWAVKEKISQKSFNRLLEIPEVYLF